MRRDGGAEPGDREHHELHRQRRVGAERRPRHRQRPVSVEGTGKLARTPRPSSPRHASLSFSSLTGGGGAPLGVPGTLPNLPGRRPRQPHLRCDRGRRHAAVRVSRVLVRAPRRKPVRGRPGGVHGEPGT